MRLWLTAGVLSIAGACGSAAQTFSWNQRMTVTVETPEGPVTGSTVYEISAAVFPRGGGLAGDVAASYRHRGEAVVVELGEDRFIFALAIPSGDILYIAAPERYSGLSISDREIWLPEALANPDPIIVPERNYPRFVTFGDIDDPLTADIFEAGEMEAIFGQGYGILSVSLEIVDAPIDVGRIEEALPWHWAFDQNTTLDGQSSHPANAPEANLLGVGSFSTELFE